MPMPISSEMNMTEKTVRCPTVSVMRASDHARLTTSTASITSGSTTRRQTASRKPSVSAKASAVARVLAWNAVSISSLESAGVPVTPAATPGAEKAARKARGDPVAAAVGGAGRRGPPSLLLYEPVVLDYFAAYPPEPLRGEIQQRVPLEQIRIDPPRYPPGARQSLEDGPQPIGERLRPLHAGSLDDDHEVVELAKLLQRLLEALNVRALRRHELDRRRLERQLPRGVDGGEDGERQAQDDRQPRAGDRDPNKTGERRAAWGRRHARHRPGGRAVTTRPIARSLDGGAVAPADWRRTIWRKPRC